MRIAFAHTKGGVGKTTASIMLAAAVEKRGIPVVVYDADPQASASRWAEVAIARDDPLGFEVKRVNAQFLRNLSSDSAGWHIIDTPPGSAAEIQAAIDIADLVIVPTHPSPMDLDRV
jgi:virC1 protein